MDTPEDMAVRLSQKIRRRRDEAETWYAYYDGRNKPRFLTEEFRRMYGPMFEGFSDNWARVVVDSTNERIVPTAFKLADGSIDQLAWDAWRRNSCDVEFPLASLDALIAKRSFGLVWKDDETGQTDITFLSASQAAVEFVPGRRRRRAAGFRMWHDDGTDYGVLFLPDVVYWMRRQTHGGGAWEIMDSRPNPLGVVPLVPLENRGRLSGHPVSEVEAVAPLQDAINSLWTHLLAASDDRALPTRVVKGTYRPTREIVDENGEVIGEEDLPLEPYRTNRLLWLEDSEASIAEFSAANLSNFTDVISLMVKHIAAQTRTPAHYLLGDMVNVSADALAALESGLVSKVMERQRFFGLSLRELMSLEARASGDVERAEALAGGTVEWRDPQFRSEAQYADALVKYKAIGVPDEALWARLPGSDPSDVERWRRMRTDQAAAIIGGDIASLLGPKPDEGQEEA